MQQLMWLISWFSFFKRRTVTHVALIIIFCSSGNSIICWISLVWNTLSVRNCCIVSGHLRVGMVEGSVSSVVCPTNLVVKSSQLQFLLGLCLMSCQVGHVQRALSLDNFMRNILACNLRKLLHSRTPCILIGPWRLELYFFDDWLSLLFRSASPSPGSWPWFACMPSLLMHVSCQCIWIFLKSA